MIEPLRIPAFQKTLALLVALVLFCYTYHLATIWTVARAMRVAPHDGQAGLGAAFLGLMTGLPVAKLAYHLIKYWLQTWEKRYARKLDEADSAAIKTMRG
jgi:peptidoglycan/LPS O-acetylase OafA/YrhL